MNDLTNLLNEFAKNYQGEPEEINDDDLIRAIYYLDNLFITNEVDALIYLVALNLCNAYAKKEAKHDIYKFKKGIGTLIDAINDRKISGIKACQTKDKGNIYIFEVGKIQFTFHDEKDIPIDDFYYHEMKWDGIKKQPCAKTLFNACVDSEAGSHAITTTGKPIRLLVDKLLDDYHKEVVTFDEILDNL